MIKKTRVLPIVTRWSTRYFSGFCESTLACLRLMQAAVKSAIFDSTRESTIRSGGIRIPLSFSRSCGSMVQWSRFATVKCAMALPFHSC